MNRRFLSIFSAPNITLRSHAAKSHRLNPLNSARLEYANLPWRDFAWRTIVKFTFDFGFPDGYV